MSKPMRSDREAAKLPYPTAHGLIVGHVDPDWLIGVPNGPQSCCQRVAGWEGYGAFQPLTSYDPWGDLQYRAARPVRCGQCHRTIAAHEYTRAIGDDATAKGGRG